MVNRRRRFGEAECYYLQRSLEDWLLLIKLNVFSSTFTFLAAGLHAARYDELHRVSLSDDSANTAGDRASILLILTVNKHYIHMQLLLLDAYSKRQATGYKLHFTEQTINIIYTVSLLLHEH
jgi:hypothetical protein